MTVLLITAVLAGAVLTVVVSGSLRVAGTWSRPDPEVALPAPDRLSRGSPLSAQERAEALAPFDERRLRCEPVGCELWRLEPGSAFRGAWSDEDGSVVVVAMDQALLLVDPDTGHPVWRASLDAVDGKDASGRPGAQASWTDHVEVSDDLVVAIGAGTASAHDRATGELRWSVTTGDEPWWGRIVGSTVLLVGGLSVGAEWTEQITALDAADGSVRWSTLAAGAYPTDHGVVVREGEETSVRDLETGEIVHSEPGLEEVWLDALGPWLARVVQHEATTLLDPATGDEVAHLDGSSYGAVEIADHLVVLMAGAQPPSADVPPAPSNRGVLDGGAAIGLDVVALTADGEVAWRRPFGTMPAWDCCPGVVAWFDGTVLVHGPGDPSSAALDVATGEPRHDVPSADPPAGSWVVGSGVWLDDKDGAGDRIELHTPDGTVTVTGRGPWVVHHDPLVVQDQHALIGVRVPDTDGSPHGR